MRKFDGFEEQEKEGFDSPLAKAPGAEVYADKAHRLIVVRLSEEPVGDIAFLKNTETPVDDIVKPMLLATGAEEVMVYWEENENVCFWVYSDTKKTRAVDFLNDVLKDVGAASGNHAQAEGTISIPMFRASLNEASVDSREDAAYVCGLCASYFEDLREIWPAEYSASHKDEILSWKPYRKQRKKWFYIKSSDVAGPGSKISVKSLENESGNVIEGSDDTYIMVGGIGEVYYCTRQKFETAYEEAEGTLDVFEEMTLYLPEVEVIEKDGQEVSGDDRFVSLDGLAHVCMPKRGGRIYGTPLEHTTKIFPVYDPEEYFLGHSGDYMVARSEDLSDIYIVKRSIFLNTYELEE